MSGQGKKGDNALGLPAGWRIVLVGPAPPPSGGMATQTAQLIRLLKAEGVAVDFVQTNAPYRPAWVGRLRGLRALFRLIPYLGALWRAAGKGTVFHVMANSGWSWDLFAAPAIWIASLRGVPVVVNYRGGEAAAFFEKAMPRVRPSLRRCAAVVVPSGFLREVFGRWGMEVRVVPNIIDLSRFSGDRETTAGVPGRPYCIVTRNLEAIYDVQTAIEAFARIRERHPQATLSVAGEGDQRETLERRCRELGLAEAVRFTGRLSHEAMAALYRSADLMLNPSRADNMPNSLLEAMASGVPVVSTNVGGIPYLVQDGVQALLVPPGQPARMAEAALRLLDDEGLQERLRGEGRRLVEGFTWPVVAGQWGAVYREAVNGRRMHP